MNNKYSLIFNENAPSSPLRLILTSGSKIPLVQNL